MLTMLANPYVRVVLLIAAQGLAFLIGVKVLGRRLDGPGRSIVVVDRRTYRLATARIAAADEAGDHARAHAGRIAQRLWLRGEIHTGPRRRRARYAADLEQLELAAAQAGSPLPGTR